MIKITIHGKIVSHHRFTPTLIFQDFQPIAAIATTPLGVQLLQRSLPNQTATLWVPESLRDRLQPVTEPSLRSYSGSLKAHLASLWASHRSFVFCLATGAVVRLIAPLLQDKASDPAVVVLDEAGQFVISLTGGHQGGSDRLSRLLALQLGATPVLTGASNSLGLPGIDVIGLPFGWVRGEGDWTGVSAAIARQAPVQVIQEAGTTLWRDHLPPEHPLVFAEWGDQGVGIGDEALQAAIWITPRLTPNSSPPSPPLSLPPLTPPPPDSRSLIPDRHLPTIHWHPRILWVGIGCERGTSRQVIESAIQQVFQQYGLAEAAIAGIATIDLKADEVGLVEFCRDRALPLRCYPAETLRTIPVPTPSAIVETEVGTPSVAEAAALRAIQDFQSCTDVVVNRVSAPTPNPQSPIPNPQSPPSLLIPKQIFRLENQPGAVTLAVAQAEREYTGRIGQLWLVGTGPGQLEQMTPAAQTAIAQADAVIGYSLYIDLIRPLFRPGQIVETLPITQERQRAERAIALANWGLTVAVVSSGDCGIYGMAGLVLEQLRAQNWDGKTPAVQVFPGITALQATASRVGAPLMHDFCAISLSDLLTPWEVIEKRLTAAAQADFVVALYNPKSKTRVEQIAIAQRIFLQYRDPLTPVALVRSAYRTDEHITLTTLAELLTCPIDMLTTVLIGNQSTRTYANWMITPRGYLGFDGEDSVH